MLLHLVLLLVLVGFEALHSVESVEGKGWDGMAAYLHYQFGGRSSVNFFSRFCFVLDTHHQ